MRPGARVLILVMSFLTVFSVSRSADQETSKKGWLGVSIRNVTEKVQKKQKLASNEGALVADVVEDSPADSAGIREGDVITTFAGKQVSDPDDLTKFVSRTAPGTKVDVVVMRDGARKTIGVVVGRQKRNAMAFNITVPDIPNIEFFGAPATLGLTGRTLNEQLGEYFGAPNNEGVLVEEVQKDGVAEKAGIKAGDVIVRIGKRSVAEVADISKELRKADEGDKVEVEVIRKGARKTMTVEIAGAPAQFKFQGHPRIMIAPRGGRQEWRSESEDGAAVIPDEMRRRLDDAHGELRELQRKMQQELPRIRANIPMSVTL